MHIAKVKNFDTANGDGIGLSIFVSGCEFQCTGCCNQEAWNFSYGDKFTYEKYQEIISLANNAQIDHFSILGGEPLNSNNIIEVAGLVFDLRRLFSYKKIWIWTGYDSVNEAMHDKEDTFKTSLNFILRNIDYITFGRFDINQRDIRRKYSGSRNQYTLNLRTKEIVEEKSSLFFNSK